MSSYKFFVMMGTVRGVIRTAGDVVSTVPLDMKNMDCRQFLADWQAGATVKDAEDADVPYSEEAVSDLGLGS